MSLIKKIKEFNNNNKRKKIILFTTPSHSQGEFIPKEAKRILGKTFYKNDFSEIEGFDNLRNPTGILRDLQEKLSLIYNTKNTFILTNGSTSGIIAAMKAVLKTNDKVLVARNCHISVYNGLVLTSTTPIWFYPNYNNDWDIFEEIKPQTIEKELINNKEIKAVIITSPTYEGIHSNIKEISQICKKYNKILIVDEAHGALSDFVNSESKSAITNGADISIQSLHKTAGAPNPCALLHINKDSLISITDVQNALNLINTTSPSYPLIAAIEATVDFLNSPKGKKKLNELKKNINDFKKNLNKKFSCYPNNDITKILIQINNQSQKDVVEYLNNSNIEEEMSNDKSMLFITGIGTSDKKLKKLLKTLNNYNFKNGIVSKAQTYFKQEEIQVALTPQQAYENKKSEIPVADAIGQISGETIMQYPPGIPLLLPGEVICDRHVKAILKEKIKICI